jgi:glucosamine-6-phosphate deaminase
MLTDMSDPSAVAFGHARVIVHSDVAAMARAAADRAAEIMREAVRERGVAHVMFATGNSQLAFVETLVARTADVPWADTIVFHMDEYVGIGPDHPAGFQKWIRERIVEPTSPRAAYYVDGQGEAGSSCARYADLLAQHPLDLCCLGIGENGHLAFNDPGVADFSDPLDVKVVELDAACRQQQVNEGHFPDLASVPSHAITVTIPALLRAAAVIAVVPEARKAEPVRAALTGPLSVHCPASALRTIPYATIYLEPESARLLQLGEVSPPRTLHVARGNEPAAPT